MPQNITKVEAKTAEERFFEKVERNGESECWLWTGASNASGYGRIRINDTLRYAHRVSPALHAGQIPEGQQANHLCDNPRCVNPEHLYTGDQQQNIDDAVERGDLIETRNRGEEHPHAKLSADEVSEIRNLYRTSDHTHRSLAEEFKVGKGTIQSILERESWTSIESSGGER